MLKSILTTAVNDELLQRNPCILTGKALPALPQREPVLLKPKEIEKVAASEVMPERYRMMILLAGWCGLRWGEVTELRRCDIAEDGSVLAITRAVTHRNGKCNIGTTKTDATRTVAAPDHLREKLLQHMAIHVMPEDEALLFAPYRDGCHVNDKVFRDEWFKPALKAVGAKDIRFHDLRHFGGTMATLAGGSLRDVMKRLGHRTVKAAMFYQAIVEGRDDEIAAALSKLVADGDNGEASA